MTATVRLGRSEISVSRAGLGCNNLGRADSTTADQAGTDAVVHAALDAGVLFFDTADVYGATPGLSETLLGQALRDRRPEAVIGTKFGFDLGASSPLPGARRGSAPYVRAAVDASLRRLGTDWIDLYQYHVPDTEVPIAETLGALGELVTAGKVRAVGCSNFSATELDDAATAAHEAGIVGFVSVQNEFSLLRRQAESDVLPAAERLGMSFLPYYPLFNGVFSGKFDSSGGPAASRIMSNRPQVLDQVPWDRFEQYRALCAEVGTTVLDATFAWLLAHPRLASVIAGATSAEQVASNAAASTTVLDAAVLDRIDRIFAVADDAPTTAADVTPATAAADPV